MELRVIEPGLKHLDLEADRRPLIPKSLIDASVRGSNSQVVLPIQCLALMKVAPFSYHPGKLDLIQKF